MGPGQQQPALQAHPAHVLHHSRERPAAHTSSLSLLPYAKFDNAKYDDDEDDNNNNNIDADNTSEVASMLANP